MAQKDTGTDLVPFGQYAVASFDKDTLGEALSANLGGTDVNLDRDLDRVKVPGSGGLTWTVPTLDGEQDTDTLTGVIVAWKNTRAFYMTSFEEAPNQPPDCASADSVTGYGIRHAEQDEPSSLPCAQCPNAQWGSGRNNGQACQQNRLLFMLTPGDMLPIIVKLPATSIKPCADYFLRLTRKGKPYFAVQTSIKLERQDNATGIKYSEARFALSSELEADEITTVKQYRDALAPIVERTSGHDTEAPAEAA